MTLKEFVCWKEMFTQTLSMLSTCPETSPPLISTINIDFWPLDVFGNRDNNKGNNLNPFPHHKQLIQPLQPLSPPILLLLTPLFQPLFRPLSCPLTLRSFPVPINLPHLLSPTKVMVNLWISTLSKKQIVVSIVAELDISVVTAQINPNTHSFS